MQNQIWQPRHPDVDESKIFGNNDKVAKFSLLSEHFATLSSTLSKV